MSGAGRDAALHGELGDAVAYWSPLLHLTMGGLGWTNVPLGLWRWIEIGRPVDDPVLRTIGARWGEDLDLFIRWACQSGREGWNVSEAAAPLRGSSASDPRYQRWFGGGSDNLHLRAHAQWMPNVASEPREGWREVTRLIPKGSRGDHAVITLVSDCYVDLFDALAHDLIEPQVGEVASCRAVVSPYRLARHISQVPRDRTLVPRPTPLAHLGSMR